MLPIVLNELVHRFLLKQSVEVSEQVDGHNFLVSKRGLGVIAQTLKTGFRLSIVNVTDKQIQLNELKLHGKSILPIRLACLSSQLLIHITMSEQF